MLWNSTAVKFVSYNAYWKLEWFKFLETLCISLAYLIAGEIHIFRDIIGSDP